MRFAHPLSGFLRVVRSPASFVHRCQDMLRWRVGATGLGSLAASLRIAGLEDAEGTPAVAIPMAKK
jgi:hypothetical protein